MIISENILAECFQGSETNPDYGLIFGLNKPGTMVKSGARAWMNIPGKPILP